ncbi:extracellular triacylglycerol lipase precursor [Mycena albidolilacea]|uniref:Carboxylic ester hydrolase n=1 Tax=Mycena albidolilacea TaxID=1033008 RepID=A0AAD6ZAZ1_9AGAR|nr:extracellular triacylglycerol lipase precursor [Mycena albidolilacea]
MSLLVAALFLLNLVLVRDVQAQPTSSPRVHVGTTSVIGTTGPDTVEFFGGLPFAQPPLGNLRFRSPVPVTTLGGSMFNATNWGAGCPQVLDTLPGPVLSEDCLNLNIFRPAGTKASAELPVMVWIYGGDFRIGAAASYNGSTIVARSATRGTPIIYVNFNYRLGSLGFPTGFEADEKKALNLGLRDQIAALSWIQENIEFFGGDKHKVALFGESAGAISIADLFLNSDLENYVHGAIFESGTMGTNRLLLPSDGQGLWTSFLSMIPACANTSTTFDSFECLRNVPVEEIVTAHAAAVATTVVGWTPVIDGPGGFIPDLPSKLVAEGHFSRIPFISGTNLDEGTLFVDPSVATTDDLRLYIASQLPGISDPAQMNATVDRMMELYPDDPALGSPFGTGNETFGLSIEWKRGTAISCDVNFSGVRRGWTQAASKFGVKTFVYLFNDPQLDAGFLGIPHASEVSYVYGTPTITFVTPGSPEAFAALSPVIMDYWISFASTLDPNDGKGVKRAHWEQFTPTHQALMQLHAHNVTMIPDDFRVAPIAFINDYAPYFGH